MCEILKCCVFSNLKNCEGAEAGATVFEEEPVLDIENVNGDPLER